MVGICFYACVLDFFGSWRNHGIIQKVEGVACYDYFCGYCPNFTDIFLLMCIGTGQVHGLDFSAEGAILFCAVYMSVFVYGAQKNKEM